MIDHTGIGVADVSRSAVFYDAALAALGLRRVMQMPDNAGTDGIGYGIEFAIFWIDRFHPHGVRQHTAFAGKDRAQVDAFYAAAMLAGGTDNGPPGLRDPSEGHLTSYYAAFVLDPDGNNIEAVYRGAIPEHFPVGARVENGEPRIETAACFCGDIRAEMRGEPFWINYDHDDDCRRAIGGPLTIWVGYRPNQFKITRGEPKTFSKTSGVIRSFCGRCGSSIGYCDEGIPDEYYVTIGFFDHPERFQPHAHGYWKMRLPGIEFADELPRIDGYTRKRDPKIGNPNSR